jgi:predicted secreted acid phosphatase
MKAAWLLQKNKVNRVINIFNRRSFMKHSIIFLISAFAFGITNASHPGYENLINYRLAVQELERTHNKEQFEEYEKLIIDYYVSGVYEDHLRSVCVKAQKYFDTVKVKKDSLIVFDIDDTALYHFHVHDDFKFIWKHIPDLAQNRALGHAPAIKPVKEFYDYLIKRGFKVVFLTCRPDDTYDETVIELNNGKFNVYEELICMPLDLAQDSASKYGLWKFHERERLAQKYTIVGCIGDRERDFEGGLTGHIVRLPNYLQRPGKLR